MRSRHPQVALLGDRQDRTSALLDRAEVRLSAAGVPVLRLDAATVTRRAMLAGLRSGVDVAIYTGHGTPMGWPTYGGVRPQDLAGGGGEPVGALVLLTCHAASYAQQLVEHGAAQAVVAAGGEVSHQRNVGLLSAIVTSLTDGGSTTVEELLGSAGSLASAYSVFAGPAMDRRQSQLLGAGGDS